VSALVVELEHAAPSGLRDALARALGDPTLEVAFSAPAESDGRAVTRLEHDGALVAALVHDPALLDEPELIEGAAAAARIALENARLNAELRAQLALVKESRARIVAATDAERRRIERDLHDGAQQRLVTLALELRSAQGRLGPDGRELLDSAVAQLQDAVGELRELAHGVHPALLTERGLAAALESLAIRAPLPVVVEDAPPGRLAPEVEAAAYFVVSEGLANVFKHAGAASATVGARRENGRLLVEVADDGIGGAGLDAGSGLRGLADRVEALGGALAVDSPRDGGTRLRAEIPCAS
jgi:signal transduction histidine kinase